MALSITNFDIRPTPRNASLFGTIQEIPGAKLEVPEGERIHVPYIIVTFSVTASSGALFTLLVKSDDNLTQSFEFDESQMNSLRTFRIPGPFYLSDTGEIQMTYGGGQPTDSGTISIDVPHVSYAFRGDFEWSDVPLVNSSSVFVYGADAAIKSPEVHDLNAVDITANPWNTFLDLTDPFYIEVFGKKGVSVFFRFDAGTFVGNLEVRVIFSGFHRSFDGTFYSFESIEPYYLKDFQTQQQRTHILPGTTGDKFIEIPTDGRIQRLRIEARALGATDAKIEKGGMYLLSWS
jgi:hypothetical protein